MDVPSLERGAHLNRLLDEGRHNEADREIRADLNADPENRSALYFLCRLFIDTDRAEMAYPVAKALSWLAPDWHLGHFALGLVETHLRRPERAVEALTKSLMLKRTANTLGILSSAFVMLHDFDKAKLYAEQSLEMGESHIPHIGLAFYHLHRREWKEGWKHYTYQIGRTKDRPANNYGLEPWQGKGSVLIYGEQGLGDQLCYVSSIDDRCKQLVCHPKLANLLKRSLHIPVYGDQFADRIDWEPRARHQAAMSEAMQWQKVKRRGRWLKPHSDKREQWKALMHARAKVKDRPWIGIAWTGGRTEREIQARQASMGELKALLDLPVNLVSLEYRPHGMIPGVHNWPWATQTDDLDDVAALVDNLDMVVTVPNTTYHLAGSLGIPCHVLVHDKPHFHEGHEGPCPWWESVKFHRGDRRQAVAEIAEEIMRL